MYSAPGSELLEGAVDCHLHVCPHLNGRSVTVFGAVRQAAAAGMIGIGLMDNFANSGGLAALVMTELDDLRVDVFGGIILENVAGGVSSEVVEVAIGIGYGPGQGARFVSLPCHNTRHVARTENRSAAYIECCYGVPLTGELSDETKKILDLCAARDVVFNTGHVAGEEAVRLCYEAKKHGVERFSSLNPRLRIRDIIGRSSLRARHRVPSRVGFLCRRTDVSCWVGSFVEAPLSPPVLRGTTSAHLYCPSTRRQP